MDISIDVPLSPEAAWGHASNLAEFGDWLTIHEDWRGPVPQALAEGVQMTSVLSVKGLRTRVDWTVVECDEPHRLRLLGKGKAPVKIDLALVVKPTGDTAILELAVDMGGRALFGPVGVGVAHALKGDVKASLENFLKRYAS